MMKTPLSTDFPVFIKYILCYTIIIKLKEGEHVLTIDDIYALPDGQRAELIDGRMYMMETPARSHQGILSFLLLRIGNYLEAHGNLCEIYLAPFAVFLDKNIYTYVEPDISVICDKNKLNDKGCNGAPDWVIEIVSPSSKQMDYLIKLLKYQAAGVREYWIIDYEKNLILVYNFEANLIENYTLSDTVKTGIYEDLEINFSKLDI